MSRTIVWFRQDLRIIDNPALFAAAKCGMVLPIYIHDTNTPEEFTNGAAAKAWLYHALNDLNHSLKNNLYIFKGNPREIILQLVIQENITAVNWNQCYDKYQIKHDIDIKEHLHNNSITVNIFNANLLWEPWKISKPNGGIYKVFTPYYRKGCLHAEPPRSPLPAPQKLDFIRCNKALNISRLDLLPKIRWDIDVLKHWEVSETAAHKLLHQFITEKISHYKIGRDFPHSKLTSNLSPYLHFGQISPHLIWEQIKNLNTDVNTDGFMCELGWREFSYYLLYHFPNLPQTNWNGKFDQFPWQFNPLHFKAWQQGKTGIPIVDAGMRELWQTGYMHNRVRMIVASFLTKNLLIDWRYGAKWFLDTLFDADIANNSASWQWVAGSGADAQPFFRIFNPVLQSEKFDPEGIYIKKYVPELQDLPIKYIFAPWLAPKSTLLASSINLGRSYPYPIVDLTQSRHNALHAFKILK